MKDFYDDLEREKSSIEDVIKIYQNKSWKFVNQCNNNEYDILFQNPEGVKKKIEVKQDFSCFRTGNVGVEYHCRGKESGIFTSKSDIYVYKLHQNKERVYKSHKERDKPLDVTIIEIDKKKLKSCITQLVLENEVGDLNYIGEESRKRNFRHREITDNEGNTYIVEVRFINGGDIGSNSLNVLFTRNSFINIFGIEVLQNRDRTEQEDIDLKATLDNAQKRFKKR